jgi:hypothetical protein
MTFNLTLKVQRQDVISGVRFAFLSLLNNAPRTRKLHKNLKLRYGLRHVFFKDSGRDATASFQGGAAREFVHEPELMTFKNIFTDRPSLFGKVSRINIFLEIF